MSYKVKGGKAVGKFEQVNVNPFLKVSQPFLPIYKERYDDLLRVAVIHQNYHCTNTQKAVSLHEAGHCIVAVTEGKGCPKGAKVWLDTSWLPSTDHWQGQTSYADDKDTAHKLTDPSSIIPWCCRMLAGRTAERLFCKPFDLTGGLDELVYANITVHNCAIANKADHSRWWSYTLQRTERSLRDNETAIRAIADVLFTKNSISPDELAHLTKDVARQSPDIDIPADVKPIFDPIECLAALSA